MKIQQRILLGIFSNLSVIALIAAIVSLMLPVRAGNLPWEIWALDNYPSIQDLIDSGTLDTTPDVVYTIPDSFDTYNVAEIGDLPDDYSSRVRGFLQVPETGTYYLGLSSADESQLSISTNYDPANLVLVAQETNSGAALFSGARLAQRTSPPLYLVKGQSYYLEVLHTAGSGSSWIEVGWQTPEGLQEIIPALYLLPWSPDATTPSFSDQPAGTNIVEGNPLILTTTAQVLQPATFQWYLNGVPIAGANDQSLVYPNADPTNSGQYYLSVTDANNNTAISSNATVTVQLDTTPPTVVSVELNSRSNLLTVVFSKVVDQVSATTAGNYTLNNGVTLSGATLAADNETVTLNVSGLAPGQSNFQLSVSGVADHYSNVIVPVTLPVDLVWTETFSGGPGFFTATNNNQTNGNSFGYSFSINAGGAVGEIGGTFARNTTAIPAYIADPTLGTAISLANNVVFRGQLFIHNINANDNFFFGFAPTAGNFSSILGIQIAEPNSTFAPNFRGQGLAVGASSVNKYPIPPDVVVPFDLSWDAASGILTANVGNQEFYVTNQTAALTTFSSLVIGTYGEKTIVTADNALLYFDNLTYSVGSVRTAPVETGPTVGAILQSPVNGEVYEKGVPIALTAQALTAGQPVANVSFYQQLATGGSTVEIGVTNNPSATNILFDSVWNGAQLGNYNLTALAITEDSLTATSAPVSVYVVAPQPLSDITEPFTTGLDRFQTETNNEADGNNFGFSDTQNAGGAATGEAGGLFVRSTSPAYLADTNTGNLYPQFEDLDLSGQLYLQNNNWNGTAFIGYINNANFNASFGISIDEPDADSNFRGYVVIGSASSAEIDLPPGTPISFSLHWSSTNQTVTGTLAGQPVSLPYVPLTEVFNALGIGTFINASSDSTEQLYLYTDDLNYSIVSPLPNLSISFSHGQTQLSWSASGYKLQYSTSLGSGASWHDDSATVSSSGGIYSVSEVPAGTTVFWRLITQ